MKEYILNLPEWQKVGLAVLMFVVVWLGCYVVIDILFRIVHYIKRTSYQRKRERANRKAKRQIRRAVLKIKNERYKEFIKEYGL